MKLRNRTKVVTFFVLFFTGVAFGAWGMFLPPQGDISGSVLILIAQVFVLAASIWGFEVHFDIKEGKFDAGHKNKSENEDI